MINGNFDKLVTDTTSKHLKIVSENEKLQETQEKQKEIQSTIHKDLKEF